MPFTHPFNSIDFFRFEKAASMGKFHTLVGTMSDITVFSSLTEGILQVIGYSLMFLQSDMMSTSTYDVTIDLSCRVKSSLRNKDKRQMAQTCHAPVLWQYFDLLY